MLLRFWDREDAIGSASAHEPTWLAKLLHQFPHFDANIQPVHNVFAPTLPYGESLVVLSALPVIWLLFTLLLFLIFFCVRCCQACLKARYAESEGGLQLQEDDLLPYVQLCPALPDGNRESVVGHFSFLCSFFPPALQGPG
jgi:hypothetical protein